MSTVQCRLSEPGCRNGENHPPLINPGTHGGGIYIYIYTNKPYHVRLNRILRDRVKHIHHTIFLDTGVCLTIEERYSGGNKVLITYPITNDVNLDDFLKSGTRKIQGTRKLGEYSSDTGSSSSFSHHYSMLTYHLFLCADYCVMICSFSLHLHFVHPRVFVDIHSYSFAYNKFSPPP